MLFRTQIIFCSSELRLHFRIAEVGSLLSLNRAWRAQVTYGRLRSYLFVFVAVRYVMHEWTNFELCIASIQQTN